MQLLGAICGAMLNRYKLLKMMRGNESGLKKKKEKALSKTCYFSFSHFLWLFYLHPCSPLPVLLLCSLLLGPIGNIVFFLLDLFPPLTL